MSSERTSLETIKAVAPELRPSASDDDFAEWFVEVAKLIEGCRRHGQVAVLLSTCRNQWMTVNATFFDLKQVLTLTSRRDPAGEALIQLELGELREARVAAERGLFFLSQAREKLDAWEQRESLIAEFEEQIETLRHDAASERRWRRLQRWYEGQRSGRAPGVTPEQTKFIALNLDDDGMAATHFSLLQTSLRRLRLALQIVTHAVRLLEGDSDELMLFEPPSDDSADSPPKGQTVEETWSHLLERLEADATYLGASWRPDGQGYRLAFPDSDLVMPNELPERPELRACLADLRLHASAAVDQVRTELRENFLPNVAERPLPDPYVLDLRPQHATREAGRDFEISWHRVANEHFHDTARVAILECGMPESAYSHENPDLYVFDRAQSPGAIHAREIALAAIDAAAANGACLLALPEVFLPRANASEIYGKAQERDVMLVTGLEYEPLSGRPRNEVVVVSSGLAGPLAQRKQRPSVYELRESLFEADGRLTIIRDSRIGVFAVAVCSDYLELDLIWALASQPERLDVIFVIARNPLPEVFRQLAIADAVRLHAYVVVVNSFASEKDRVPASGKGTLIAQPGRTNPCLELEKFELPVVWDKLERPQLAFANLELAKLRQLDTERAGPTKFLRPPEFPRRP